jgi:hypothetical protein
MRPYLVQNPSQKRAGRVAQGVGPEFKSQYCKKKKGVGTAKGPEHLSFGHVLLCSLGTDLLSASYAWMCWARDALGGCYEGQDPGG